MMVRYEVWDLGSGNQVESFASEREALDLVRKLVESNGAACLDDLALGEARIREGQQPELLPFIEGDELRARIEVATGRARTAVNVAAVSEG